MKTILKIFLWIIGSIIFLLLLLYVLIQVPAVQNFALQKTISFLQTKIKTKIEIGTLNIDFPKLIVLKGLYFEDQNGDTLLAAEFLKVDISLFKLLNNQLQINEIDLQGITAKVQRTLPDSVFNFDYILKAFSPKTASADTTPGMKFSVEKITLSRIRLSYQDAVTASDIKFRFNYFETRFREFNLVNMKFAIADIKLSGLNASIIQSKHALKQNGTAKETVSTRNNDLKITIGSIDLRNINLKYDDFNKPIQPQGMDYAHIELSDLNLQARNFSYNRDSISGNIDKASLSNKDGFVLNTLQTNFSYSNTGVILNKLYLKTPNTTLRDYVMISYPSLDTLAKNPGILGINVNFLNSSICFKDVLTFVPELANVDPFKNNHNAIVTISGNINGSLAELYIPDLLIRGFETTKIDVSGNITGLPDMNHTNFDVIIRALKSGSNDLKLLLSVGVIPETMRMPKDFSISGKFNGGISSFVTKLDMNSSYGNAFISADLQKGNQKGNEVYKASIKLIDFNAGHLLKQDTILGRISGHVEVAGTSIDPKTLNAKFSLLAKSAEVKGYTYKNMVLEGIISNQNLLLRANMNDQNIKFKLDAKANLHNKYPAVNFTLNIDTLNLQNLNLYNADLQFQGKIVADLPSTNPDSLIGTLSARNLAVTLNGKPFRFDSVYVKATDSDEQKELLIKSEVLTANLNGQYKLTEIGNVLSNEINKYFKIGDGLLMPVSKTQDFNFTLDITNQPIVQEFAPLLTQMEPIQLKGSFNSNGLKMEASTSKIIWSGTSVDSLKLVINSDGNALNYSLKLDKISTDSFYIYKTSFTGKVKDNQATLRLNSKDKSDKNKYILAGLFSKIDSKYQFRFNKDSLMLNHDAWTVTPENFVQYGSMGFMASNLKLTNKGQELSINSTPQQLNAPLNVTFTNFNISTITSFSDSKKIIADGIINGRVDLSNLKNSPVFVSDLVIKDFSFHADTLGDISLKVNNIQTNTYAANIIISGKGNDIVLDGNYFIKPQHASSFNFDLDIRNLNLTTIETYSMGNLKNTSGNIDGKLTVSGSSNAPVIRGNLHFNQTAFNITKFNSYYTIVDEKVNFTSEGIHFDSFTLVDSTGNKAIVNGSLFTTNYMDYRFGLDISSRNFKILSSTKKDNKLFYGQAYIDSDLHLRGDMSNPKVEGSVRINNKTNLTIVIPQRDPGVVARDGVVEFVDAYNMINVTKANSQIDSLNISTISGMDISLNLVADSNAVFNIIIDEVNGDFLKIQGNAQLTAGIDPSGKINLTGTFDITAGAYELSFNFIKKRFIIQRGSLITWLGEPTTADLHVTAVYLANAAPYDLVANKLDESPATLNHYKQKLPFEVTLNMQGELMKPLLTFEIILPKRNYNVSQDVVDNVQYRLTQLKSQPSELNKQVFSLLLLNRFVAENPFAGIAGSNRAESLARSSVSKILSEQMNQLAGNLINGVDLNFDLISSDYVTTGALQNRTDLNIGVSKQLMNERLKVSIGSNFELEGPKYSNQNASNIAGNVALDYQLSRDGRYMLRAYRKNEYQGVLEGYLIETGMGFIFTLDYKKFKEIFARKDEVKNEKP